VALPIAICIAALIVELASAGGIAAVAVSQTKALAASAAENARPRRVSLSRNSSRALDTRM